MIGFPLRPNSGERRQLGAEEESESESEGRALIWLHVPDASSPSSPAGFLPLPLGGMLPAGWALGPGQRRAAQRRAQARGAAPGLMAGRAGGGERVCKARETPRVMPRVAASAPALSGKFAEPGPILAGPPPQICGRPAGCRSERSTGRSRADQLRLTIRASNNKSFFFKKSSAKINPNKIIFNTFFSSNCNRTCVVSTSIFIKPAR